MSSNKQFDHSKCSKKELKILGDFWTLEIIQALSLRGRRFNELQRDIEGISPTTLANRLKKLEINILIQRQEETVDKLSVVYTLTEKGKDILPILRQIKIFAVKHL